MKKNNITLVFVAIVFSIIVGMIIGKSLLKYKEGEPDVVGSFSMNRDENFTVVANRKNISDKEAFARLLLKMYKENSFHSIKFSTDHGYATSLDMTVYSWKEDIHVYSVDECFIDVTNYLQLYHLTAKEMAVKLMQAVMEKTGITATAGVGTNLYLAKIAMDIVAKHVDDHIGILNEFWNDNWKKLIKV